MQYKRFQIIPIVTSFGFSIRSIRSRNNYLELLIKNSIAEIITIIVAPSYLKDIAIENLSMAGTKLYFENFEEKYFRNASLNKIIQKYSIEDGEFELVTESFSINFLKVNLGESYSTISDNFGKVFPTPNKPSLFAPSKSINQINDLIYATADVSNRENIFNKTKTIFLAFSGLKAFGTEYGSDNFEKNKIIKFMSFPFENIIPTIGKIQKILEKHNIRVMPVIVQYGNLDKIHKHVDILSRKHKLNPIPTSLNIDWNRDVNSQVAFFNVLDEWSNKQGIPNLSILHGSSCLHLVEECTHPSKMIAFYGTHTEKLELENDGRIYHLAVADSNPNWIRVVKPPIPNSHNYQLVSEEILNQIEKLFS